MKVVLPILWVIMKFKLGNKWETFERDESSIITR